MTARDPAFVAALRHAIRGQLLTNESLAQYSTFRIGGPATVLLPACPEDVATGLKHAAAEGIPWFALGLGSNVLLPDEGLDALVIRLGKGLDRVRSEGERWWIGAGLPAPLAARRTASEGFGGLHKMIGVPGTVGGGVYMNAGCHGTEWADVVRRVTVVDPSGEDRLLEHDQIPFRYRWSGLSDLIVLEVEVELSASDPDRLEREVEDLFEWRRRGTPFNQPCCGSTFTNPELADGHPSGHTSAGQFLDAAGLKGVREGGIQVSELHANYFVNTGSGTAADVRRLIEYAQQVVLDEFRVRLDTEVKVVRPDGTYDTALSGSK
ncbi:MAG: UDP-N-acetylmuramate dehydrogenase [Gemmatimonadales bacterium]